MEIEDIFSSFIRRILEVPVREVNDTVIEDFEKDAVLICELQQQFQKKHIKNICSHLKPRYIYELKDVLGLRLLIVLFNEKPFLIGPFVETSWSDSSAEQLLASLHISHDLLLSYKMYYCAWHVLQIHDVTHCISAAIQSLQPQEPLYALQELSPISSRPEHIKSNGVSYDVITHRYALENRFLGYVEDGAVEEALREWKQLSQAPSDPVFTASITLSSAIANATIVRTLLRKTVEKAGVPLPEVDTISIDYAQKIYAVQSFVEISFLTKKMIIEFTEAVKKANQERYSPVITDAVNYIRFHFSTELSTKDLAEVTGTIPGTLSRRFKAETGSTISRWIASVRCENAAKLLQYSNLSIQEIAEHVGYIDNNYFVKVFRSIYQMTPSEYRLARVQEG